MQPGKSRVETDPDGSRWLICTHNAGGIAVGVDIRLDRPEIEYRHDSAGALIMTGGILTRPVFCSLAWGYQRAEAIEARRERILAMGENTAQRPDLFEHTLATLLRAIEQAEAFIRRSSDQFEKIAERSAR